MVTATARRAYNGTVNALTPDERRRLVTLLAHTRWAALACARDDEPLAAWVAAVPEADFSGLLLHLSHLALHTRYLLTNPRASLALSERDDDPMRDPQTLARVSLQGRVVFMARGTPDYERARARYLTALPLAEVQFGFEDFYLLRFLPESARFVPGFGRVFRLGPQELRELAHAP